jgi:hypothetical protein
LHLLNCLRCLLQPRRLRILRLLKQLFASVVENSVALRARLPRARSALWSARLRRPLPKLQLLSELSDLCHQPLLFHVSCLQLPSHQGLKMRVQLALPHRLSRLSLHL